MPNAWTSGAAGVSDETTWGDWGKSIGLGVSNTARGVLGNFNQAGGTPFGEFVGATSQLLGLKLGHMEEDIVAGMSPAAQQKIYAQITDPEFWSASTIPLQVLKTTPIMAASVFAGLGLGKLSRLVSGATSGSLVTGMWINDQFNRVNNETDSQLIAETPFYADLRNKGVSENDARKQLMEQLIGNKDTILFGISVIADYLGVPGMAAGALSGRGALLGAAARGGATPGVFRRVGRGARVGAQTEFVQEGAEAALEQQGQVDIGRQQAIDFGSVASQAATGAFIGGVMGAPFGLIGSRAPRGREATTPSEPDPTIPGPWNPAPGTPPMGGPPPPITTGPWGGPRPRPAPPTGPTGASVAPSPGAAPPPIPGAPAAAAGAPGVGTGVPPSPPTGATAAGAPAPAVVTPAATASGIPDPTSGAGGPAVGVPPAPTVNTRRAQSSVPSVPARVGAGAAPDEAITAAIDARPGARPPEAIPVSEPVANPPAVGPLAGASPPAVAGAAAPSAPPERPGAAAPAPTTPTVPASPVAPAGAAPAAARVEPRSPTATPPAPAAGAQVPRPLNMKEIRQLINDNKTDEEINQAIGREVPPELMQAIRADNTRTQANLAARRAEGVAPAREPMQPPAAPATTGAPAGPVVERLTPRQAAARAAGTVAGARAGAVDVLAPTTPAPPLTSKVSPARPAPIQETEGAPEIQPSAAVQARVVEREAAAAAGRPARILTSAESAAEKEARLEAMAEGRKQDKKALADPDAKKRSHKGEAADQKKADDAAAAEQIFEVLSGSDEDPLATSIPQKKKLRERLEAVEAAAKAKDIKIPRKAGYPTTSNHIVWLAEVMSLLKAFRSDKGATDEHIQKFQIRERAARGGDFSVMRGERKAEGELAMSRGGARDIAGIAGTLGAVDEEAAAKAERLADEARAEETGEVEQKIEEGELKDPGDEDTGGQVDELGLPVEKEGVQTVVAGSARRGATLFREEEVEEQKKRDPGRSIEVTPEMRARYEGKLAPKPTPEVTSEVRPEPPKAAAAKETSQARTEAKKPRASRKPKTPAPGPEVKAEEPPAAAKAKRASHARSKKPEPEKPAPVEVRLAAAVDKVAPNPTPAQEEAGNHAMGHVSIQGVEITIERAKGDTRTGTTEGGVAWRVKLPAHYGYIKRTKGAEGDQIDVYLGDNPESPYVFVIDQVNPPGTINFDEHKVLIGFDNAAQAAQAYTQAYSDGRGADRVGGFRTMSWPEFKTWLETGDTTKALDEITSEVSPAPAPARASVPSVKSVGERPTWPIAKKDLTPLTRRDNALRTWLNALSNAEYAHLQRVYGDESIRATVVGTTDPQAVQGMFAAEIDEYQSMQSPRRDDPQWYTAAFQRWFGGSKIVDENGNPLRVYHGTAADIDQFQPGNGIFFAEKTEDASFYADRPDGSVYPVYLRATNPLILGDPNIPVELKDVTSTMGLRADEVALVSSHGYDAIWEKRRGHIVVFKPNQIKSATGNQGAFDSRSSSIISSQDVASPSGSRRTGLVPDTRTDAELDQQIENDQLFSSFNESLYEKDAAKSGRIGTVGELFEELKRTRTGARYKGIFGEFFDNVLARVLDHASDIRVYVVSDYTFSSLNASNPDRRAFYDSDGHYIVIRKSEWNDPSRVNRVLLHEAIHAAFMNATWENSPFRAYLEQILKIAKEFNGALPDGDALKRNWYGLTDINELIAEAFSSDAFQAFLARIQASPDLITALNLGRRSTLWDAFIDTVQKVLNLENINTSLLSAMLKVGGRLDLATGARGTETSQEAAREILRAGYGSISPSLTPKVSGLVASAKRKPARNRFDPYAPTTSELLGVPKTVAEITSEAKGIVKRNIPKAEFFDSLWTEKASLITDVGQVLNDRSISFDEFGAKNGILMRLIYPAMRKRIEAIAGNTKVYVLPDKVFVAHMPEAGAYYDPYGNFIVIPESSYNHKPGPYMLFHEAMHAAFMNAVWADRDLRLQLHHILIRAQDHARYLDTKAGRSTDFNKWYGLKNINELVAEAFSNPVFQEFLSRVPVSRKMVEELGLDTGTPTMWHAFLGLMRKVFNVPKIHETLMGAMIQLAPRMETNALQFGTKMEYDALVANEAYYIHNADRKRTSALTPSAGSMIPGPVPNSTSMVGTLTSKVSDTLNEVLRRPEMQDQASKPWLLSWRTFDQLAQAADRYFTGVNPVRKIADLVERIRTTAMKLNKLAEPIVARHLALERKYKGRRWNEYASLLHDETMAGVFADRPLSAQPWLGIDALSGVWSKAQHPDLAARWAALPADLKAARVEAMTFYTESQNKMSLGLIQNGILKAMGIDDPALARRIHTRTTTPADDARLGVDLMDKLLDVGELAKLEGPYTPFMRRGEWVVQAKYVVPVPINGHRINENTFEFKAGPNKKDARNAAIKYAQGLSTRPTISSVWVDQRTGLIEYSDGTRVHMNDADAVQHYRVTVQDSHIEFFQTETEARARSLELERSREIRPGSVKGVEKRHFEQINRASDFQSYQLRQLMESVEHKRTMNNRLSTAQRNELTQILNEVSLRFLGSTRIQSRRLPRRYVEGASQDVTRNILDYAQSTSGYLARLEHQPSLDEALKEMRAEVSNDYNKGTSVGASTIAEEVEKRIASQNGFVPHTGKTAPIVQRLLVLSFLDKLASPAYSLMNATQAVMVTFPVLASRHGIGRAAGALKVAYDDIGGLRVLKQGLKDTIRKVKSQEAPTSDLFADITSRVSPREAEMLEYLAEVGSIDPHAGLEIAELIKAEGGLLGAFDKKLGYLEGISRQLPKSIEMINRTASAVAAYRLELGKGATHDQAVAYAQEVVNNTQFQYANTNAAPVFNHPLFRISLQFKKYAQGMYHLLGMNLGKAVGRNSSPEERAEAIKAIAGILVTHVAMAGMLGLPTEPLKYLLLGLYPVLGFTLEDAEEKWREVVAEAVGPDVGEVISRGIPRAFGIDVSSRIGLDSLLTFAEPRSNNEADVKSWLFDNIGGAPVSMIADWTSGANELAAGNITKAAEHMVPMKVFADTLRAYREASEGMITEGGRVSLEPYSTGEALTRVFGLTPGREAETNERRTAYVNATEQANDVRTDLMQAWYDASSGERGRLWGSIERFNQGRTRDERLTRAELQSYVKRRRTEERAGSSFDGIRITRRDEAIAERVRGVYSP